MAPIESPMALNHLFVGRQRDNHGRPPGKNRTVAEAPSIAPLFTSTNIIPTPVQKARNHSQGLIQGVQIQKDRRKDPPSGDIRRQMYKTQRSLTQQVSIDSTRSSTSTIDRNNSISDSRNSISDSSTVCESDATVDNDTIAPQSTEPQSAVLQSTEPQSTELVVPVEDSADKDSTEEHPASPKDINDNKKLNDSPSHSETSTLDLSSSSVKSSDVLTLDNQDIVQGQSTHKSESLSNHSNGKSVLELEAESLHETNNSSSTPTSPISPNHSPSNGMTNLVYNSRKARNHSDSQQGNLPFAFNLPSLGQKVFNPFPSQHMSKRRAQNGIKLGLYSADNMPKLETGMVKGAPQKQFSRSQINTCLHRQYMAEVKQQAKREPAK